jgi:maleamate amidohydrolase
MTDAYSASGFGQRPVGFGERPAVLVVDFQVGFTDPRFELGKSPHVHKAVEQTAALLTAARARNVPVASCRVGWGSCKDIGYWKIGALHKGWFYGDPTLEMDPRIHDPAYDFNFIKSAPSIFFATPLMSFLTKQCVDTVIVTGCNTSGCVRASIVDAFSYGFRVIVPEDCCGDVEAGPHNSNLQDCARRYCDVVSSADVLGYFNRLGEAGTKTRSAAE